VSTHLERELSEQPEALARLFDRQRDEASRIASLLRRSDVNYILIASRGSSSNVARYAQYLLGRAHRVPVAFATPSLYTLYGQPPRLDGDALLSNLPGVSTGLLSKLGASLGDIKVQLFIPRDTHLVETALLDMTMHVAKQRLHMSMSYAVTSVNQPLTFPQ